MTFAFSQETSLGLKQYVTAVSLLGQRIEQHFAPKTYAGGIETVLVGLICVAPEFAAFMQPRKAKYTKGTKVRYHGSVAYEVRNTLQYDLVVEYAIAKSLDVHGLYEHVAQRIVASIAPENFRAVPAFPVAEFKQELEMLLGVPPVLLANGVDGKALTS